MMTGITLLKSEIDSDPLSRGYSGMSNIQVADDINQKIRSRDKLSLDSSELLDSIESSALMALTGDKATRVWGVLSMNSVDPFGIAADVFIDAFGGGSNTIITLAALRIESISRAQELGYPGYVREGHVEMARAL